MSKASREAAESTLARLCEWRGLNSYIWAAAGIFRQRLVFVSKAVDVLRRQLTISKEVANDFQRGFGL